MGALVFCVLEKINGAKWTQCPGFFTRAIVTIGHPDGHNFIRDRAFENTNLYDYRSSEYHRQDELVEKLDSVDGRRDTETGGKKFFQFYLRYKVPLFTLLTVYFQIAAHIYYYTGERCTNRYTGLQCNMNRANAAIRTSPLTMVSRTDLGHEYWRLWTYQFVHAGYEHLLTNSLVLEQISVTSTGDCGRISLYTPGTSTCSPTVSSSSCSESRSSWYTDRTDSFRFIRPEW